MASNHPPSGPENLLFSPIFASKSTISPPQSPMFSWWYHVIPCSTPHNHWGKHTLLINFQSSQVASIKLVSLAPPRDLTEIYGLITFDYGFMDYYGLIYGFIIIIIINMFIPCMDYGLNLWNDIFGIHIFPYQWIYDDLWACELSNSWIMISHSYVSLPEGSSDHSTSTTVG